MSRSKIRKKINKKNKKLNFWGYSRNWHLYVYLLSISKNRTSSLSLTISPSIVENSGWGFEMCKTNDFDLLLLLLLFFSFFFFFGGRIKSYFFYWSEKKRKKKKNKLPLVSKSLSPRWDGKRTFKLASSRWARRKRFETLGIIALSIKYIYLFTPLSPPNLLLSPSAAPRDHSPSLPIDTYYLSFPEP